jgi:hypothetical protein
VAASEVFGQCLHEPQHLGSELQEARCDIGAPAEITLPVSCFLFPVPC